MNKTAQTEQTGEGNAPREKINSITIIGRRWFDKINGNTYHSADVLVNGKHAVKVPFQYGYGNQYEWNAAAELERAGYIELEHYKNGGFSSLGSYCEQNNIIYSKHVFDLQRKRDVKGN